MIEMLGVPFAKGMLVMMDVGAFMGAGHGLLLLLLLLLPHCCHFGRGDDVIR